MRAFRVTTSSDGCTPLSVEMYYNDEHAMTLGVRQVTTITSGGSSTMNYTVSPLLTNPGSVTNPQVGATEAQGGVDPSGRPMFPALFITDLSVPPGNTNNLAGDWQFGGTGIPPTEVFGTWKAATATIDQTKNPTQITVTPDNDPTANNWNLGAGADPVPTPTPTNEGYGTEVRWDISSLNLIPGHQYRLYFMVHDGDQNQSGGDSGQGCAFITMPGTPPPTPTASPTPTPSATATATFTPTPTPTPTVSPATLAASASANNGNSVTTASFTLKANTTYLVFVFTNSTPNDSATFSSTFSGSPAFTAIGAGSQTYNNSNYNYGRWLKGGASDSTGTIKVTFAKNTSQAYLQVVKLSGNNLTSPIAQSAYTSGNNTNPYTANLPASPTSGNQEAVFLSGQEDLGPMAPPATPSSTLNLVYAHNGPGSGGSYANGTATQNTSFSGGNHHWGTIAVEINNH